MSDTDATWYIDRARCTPCASTGFAGRHFDSCQMCGGTGWALNASLRAAGYTKDALGDPLPGTYTPTLGPPVGRRRPWFLWAGIALVAALFAAVAVFARDGNGSNLRCGPDSRTQMGTCTTETTTP